MTDFGLSPTVIATLSKILQAFMPPITAVGVFGSRAQGTHRPHSDIDLVLYGELSHAQESALRLALEESTLPTKVDVVVYPHITEPGLKAHIDAVMRPFLPKSAMGI
jgi:predicted nucleotidyltransferase